MENTFNLINARLKNLEMLIETYEHYIKNDIWVDYHKERLINIKKEYSELKKEHEKLIQFCISK
jgi:hypothetical protein